MTASTGSAEQRQGQYTVSIRKVIACCVGVLAVITILASQSESTPQSTSPIVIWVRV